MGPEVRVGVLFILLCRGGWCSLCQWQPWKAEILAFVQRPELQRGCGFLLVGRRWSKGKGGAVTSGQSQNGSAKNTKGKFPCY